jgi:porin
LRINLGDGAGALMFFEAGYQRAGTEAAPILEGKYKIGGYYDTGWFANNNGIGSSHGTWAVYAVMDQQLIRQQTEAKGTFRGLSMFGRWSIAPEDRDPVSSYFDVGFNYYGPFAGREKDIAGVAFSYQRLSDELRQPSGDPVPSHHEHVLEASYQWTCNDHFSVQPDLQYIWNPGGVGTIPNAFVGGVRFTVSF